MNIINRLDAGIVANYEVPMDSISAANSISNPSELDVTVTGDSSSSLRLVPGVTRNAVLFDGLQGHISVATRGFEFDCFGDFNKCTTGK